MGLPKPTGHALNPIGFQGLYHDEETASSGSAWHGGIIHNRHRAWHTTLGRFVQRDPLGYPDGLNAYAGYHVMHGGVDPLGLEWRTMGVPFTGGSLQDSIENDPLYAVWYDLNTGQHYWMMAPFPREESFLIDHFAPALIEQIIIVGYKIGGAARGGKDFFELVVTTVFSEIGGLFNDSVADLRGTTREKWKDIGNALIKLIPDQADRIACAIKNGDWEEIGYILQDAGLLGLEISGGAALSLGRVSRVRSANQSESVRVVTSEVAESVTVRNAPRSAGHTIPDARARHIFREAEGHVADTAANRQLLKNIADDASTTLGTDRFGNTWSAKMLPDGTQAWTQTRNGQIINGGINTTPRSFNPSTGLSAPNHPGG